MKHGGGIFGTVNPLKKRTDDDHVPVVVGNVTDVTSVSKWIESRYELNKRVATTAGKNTKRRARHDRNAELRSTHCVQCSHTRTERTQHTLTKRSTVVTGRRWAKIRPRTYSTVYDVCERMRARVRARLQVNQYFRLRISRTHIFRTRPTQRDCIGDPPKYRLYGLRFFLPRTSTVFRVDQYRNCPSQTV